MKKIQDGAAQFFIVCTGILGIVSVFGIWHVFAADVITKSFETIGLLAGVTVIVSIASQFIDRGHEHKAMSSDSNGAIITEVEPVNPIFAAIRKSAIAVLIVSAVVLAFIGILSIWDVLDHDAITKSLSSLAIVAFDVFIIILTCLEREKDMMHGSKGKPLSGGAIALIGLGFLWFMAVFFK